MYSYEKLKQHECYQYMLDCVNDNLFVIVKGEKKKFSTPRYVRLQMKSLLLDLERMNDDDFEFFFDEKTMQKIINLTKIINLPDGLLRGKSCYEALAPFQWVIVLMLFSWKHKKNVDKRRYESCLISLGRKNGKTALVGLIEILLLLLEPKYSNFYSLAPNKELSNIIKKQMHQMIEVSPLLSKHFKNIKTELKCKINNNTFQPLAYNENKLDSRQISSFCVDELGEFSEDSLAVESLTSGMQNVISKLGFLISTAYPTQNNLFEEHVEYSQRILEGQIEESHHFSMIYRPNEEFVDDWTSEEAIFQSNPLATYLSTKGIDDNLDFLYKKRKNAIELPSTSTNYINKLLNIPTNGVKGQTFCSLDDLRRCKIKEYDWKDREVHVGLDLSFSQDNCGLAMLTYDNKLRKYVVQTFCFIPEDRLEIKMKLEKVDYITYCQNRWCYAVGDRIVDYAFIEELIINGLKEKFGVKVMSLSYDKYNATSTISHIEEKTDIQCIEIPQTFFALHPTVKKLQELILKEEFLYVENNLMELNFINAITVWNPSQSLCRVSKKASKFKIDILMSVINSMVTIDCFEDTVKSVYEESGIEYVDDFINNSLNSFLNDF